MKTRFQVFPQGSSIGFRFQDWNSWWFRKAPPEGIALFRIIFGLYLLFYFGLRLPHVPMLFSEAGLVIPYDLWLPASLKFLLAPPSVSVAYFLFALLLTSLLTFTAGAWTRTSAALSFLLYLYYMFLSFHNYATSYNRLFLFILFLFTFSDAGNAFSYDMRRTYGSFRATDPASILTQRLITIQLTATYLAVGFQKLWLPGWEDGNVLFYSFQGMWATPLAAWFVRQQFPMQVYNVMVLVVKAFEVALPFGLWIRKLRPWFFLGGLLFHVGIALFLKAIWWFFAMPAAYFLFYEPEEIAHTLENVRTRRRGTPPACPYTSS